MDFFANWQGRILDFGCGTGFLAQTLTELGYKSSYLGLDQDKNAIDFCQKLELPDNYKFSLSVNWNENQFDLTVFCLCLSENPVSKVKNYLSKIKSKKALIIDPSEITFYYPTQIKKTWPSKIFSRFGQKASWKTMSNPSAVYQRDHYNLKIDSRSELQVKVYRRTVGDMLNLLKDSGWVFERYWNLEFGQNDIHVAPISKFTVLLVSKNDK